MTYTLYYPHVHANLILACLAQPRNYRLYRNGNSGKFFTCVFNREHFPKKSACVGFQRLSSYTLVKRSVATRATEYDDKQRKKTEENDFFSKVKHKHDDPLARLDYVHMSIIAKWFAKITHQQLILQQNTQITIS